MHCGYIVVVHLIMVQLDLRVLSVLSVLRECVCIDFFMIAI